MTDAPRSVGPLALVGSGEYLPVMDDVDLALLARVGGPAAARVVILPTAAGLEEPSSPRRWVRMGIEHFTHLGARVAAAEILTGEDAYDPRWLELLEAADFIYFSGGSPRHLVETMVGSPAWAIVGRRHAHGAVLAGCSAGAMAFAGLTSGPHALRNDPAVEWLPALGLLPRLIVLPHFDRLVHYIGAETLRRAVRAVPAGMTLVGVDENTALVRMAPDLTVDQQSRWQVMGAQTVTLYASADGSAAVHKAGETVLVDAA